MKSFPENPYFINGMQSWLHCFKTCRVYDPNRLKYLYHYHDYIELIYALSDNIEVYVSKEHYKLNKGEFIVINSMDPHIILNRTDITLICIKFSPSILYTEENSILDMKYFTPFTSTTTYQNIFSQSDFNNINIDEIFNNIIEEWKFKNTAYELMVRSYLLRLFAEIFKVWDKHNYNVYHKEIPDNMKNVVIYIAKNYSTVTEQDAAGMCNLSYNHFSYLFKKTFGMSFRDYINSIKIKNAERMLITSNNSITDISLELGFATTSHFIEFFKKLKKVTPLKFRQRIKNEITQK